MARYLPFQPMDKIYSNKIFLTYIVYLDKHFGKRVTDQVLADAGTDRVALVASGGFQTHAFSEAFSEATIKYTGENKIPYLVGRASMESLGKVGGMILGFTSPSLCMKLLAKVEGQVALNTVIQSIPLSKNKYKVIATFKNGFKESTYACQNRQGCYEAISTVFGLPYSKVEHPQCVFEGGERCEYLVSIPEYGFLIFKQFAFALFMLSLVLGSLFLAKIGSEDALWAAGFSLILGQAFYIIYKHQNAARAMEWNALSSEGLASQNQELETTNLQINALQALSMALSEKLSIQAICDLMVATMVKEFNYSSSQIWLLNDNGVHLENRSLYGYSPALISLIKQTTFAMEKQWLNPYGLLVQTLEKGETLVVNDVDEVVSKLSIPSREFIETLNPSSFIITPLHDGQTPIGFLTAENHQGKKLDQKDKLLFQSISHIVANALVKASLFEKMEEQIVQLKTAKETAIQSEKLSSLGQMVAGVAHEIANPLNFLMNIMPDVKRDVEGLEKLRSLALKAELGEAISQQFKQVDADYDLESHLSENAYIFEKIKKSINKATQIAASLKVFSRSSGQESETVETFVSMVKDVLDLIPLKVRGATVIAVDIPPELAWKVNKNEMEQAFLAIINNAIDAMEQKGNLEITGRTLLGEILITFKDNGPGIPEPALKKIFEAFYTTKPAGKGTGLGLSIALEIIKKFGGTLNVESVVGKGTAFIFKFPRALG